MTKLNLLLLMTTALLSLNNCAASIHDFRTCSPYPGIGGASCDWFLHHDPKRLTPSQWQDQIDAWAKAGYALECTNSLAIAQNKAELEKLCSVYSCTVAQEQEVRILWRNLDRMEKMGQTAIQMTTP